LVKTLLDGIRVVDMTEALAGPYCTMYLGDMGADVVKIERVGQGDQTRGWGPPFVDGESAYFMSTNRNKRSLTLDITTPEGQAILHRLVDGADIFVNNLPRFARCRSSASTRTRASPATRGSSTSA
jgi:crotonobetainyl-CoA:carnitine CoA-transferase CaiB-like acyl-CoA transferase